MLSMIQSSNHFKYLGLLDLTDKRHEFRFILKSEAFKTVPVNLTSLLASFPSTKGRFDSFVFWLTENECSDEDEINITDSGVLDCIPLRGLTERFYTFIEVFKETLI